MATRKQQPVEIHKNTIESFSFEIHVPKPSEYGGDKDDKYVEFNGRGYPNLFPNFYLKLYNESATHGAIINQKADFIKGDGLRLKGGDKLEINVNAGDSLDDLVNKITLDYLIFNMFFVEVIYNRANQPIEYHHVPAHLIRMNRSKTKFWFANDWSMSPTKTVVYNRFKPHSKDSTSKMFFYCGYTPSRNSVYPSPEYKSIQSILADIAIADFDLNNLKNHFSPSSIITFHMGGSPSEDQMKETYDRIKKSYSGEQGAKVIIDFQSPDGKPADVKNISAGDWDKAYIATGEKIEDRIFKGHGVVSPILFAQKTSGQLGGTTEMKTAYEILKNGYVRNKRNQLQSAFNVLFADSTLVKGKVEFIDVPLFDIDYSEALKEKIFWINELRAEIGKEPLPDGDRFISETNAEPTTEPEPEPSKFSKDDELIELTEEDFEKIKDFGMSHDEFELVDHGEQVFSIQDISRIELKFETSQDIADYLLQNNINTITASELRKLIRKDLGVNVSSSELKGILNSPSAAGIVNVEGDELITKPEEEIQPVEVMYSYEVRPKMGDPIIATTRPFCKKLIKNNKLYTREDIQSMASLFNYDVFEYGGGFYRNPDTNKLTPYCRHRFKAYTVKRKKK